MPAVRRRIQGCARHLTIERPEALGAIDEAVLEGHEGPYAAGGVELEVETLPAYLSSSPAAPEGRCRPHGLHPARMRFLPLSLKSRTGRAVKREDANRPAIIVYDKPQTSCGGRVTGRIRVDTSAVDWENGLDVVRAMAPASAPGGRSPSTWA